MNNNWLTYGLIFSQLIFFSCKDSEIINLEAAIDEYLFLENKNPINSGNIKNLKSKFEKLDLYKLSKDKQVTCLYYLSKISMIENKPSEAYNFISKAYAINHADSIYQQKEKINNILINHKIANIDSTITKYSNTQNDTNLKIKEIMTKGRATVQSLYDNKKYEAAINKSQMLIMVLNELNEQKKFNIELAQLYQDLSILYAKQNQLELAKITIKKALKLNSSEENKEIKALLNK